MKKIKYYLDTTILNFAFAEDVPERKKHTISPTIEVIKFTLASTATDDLASPGAPNKDHADIRRAPILKQSSEPSQNSIPRDLSGSLLRK